ncbi:MAG: response regulator [Myxococcota bacterium]|nr:response regulator [Myxococcota bacterium]
MPRILLVDDSQTDRMIAAAVLRKHFDVSEADSGGAALEFLENNEVDLIFLDIQMPDMDGPEVLQEIRRRGNKTPVVLLTSEVRTAVIASMVQHGIETYFLKPIVPEQLLSRAMDILNVNVEVEQESDIERTLLVFDEFEQTASRFRVLLPTTVQVLHVDDLGALRKALLREKIDVVCLDIEFLGPMLRDLVDEMRDKVKALKVFGTCLGDWPNPERWSRVMNLDGFFLKPMDESQKPLIRYRIAPHNDHLNILTEKNTISLKEVLSGTPEIQAERRPVIHAELVCQVRKMVASCYQEIAIDVGEPEKNDELMTMLENITKLIVCVGAKPFFVAGNEVKSWLSGDTRFLSAQFFDSMEQCRAAMTPEPGSVGEKNLAT